MKYKYNDNELLYLLSEGVEEAQEILFEKYKNLINKRIASFRIQKRYQDDFFQEGLMMLLVAIDTYNSFQYKKTFNKYFDLILQRKFMKLLNHDVDYFYKVTLVEDSSQLMMNLKEDWEYEYEDKYDLSLLSDNENKVFNLIEQGYKPKEIALKLGLEIKSVYNCLYRLKNKL